MSEQAPFIPPVEEQAQPVPAAPWRVFSSRGFLRLWLAQVVSSLGDWIGLVAILALAARVSESAAAIALVMAARMVPGFLLAPLGGALVDRWDRRKVMVSCDLGRAALLALLPFWDTLVGLVVLSFLIEVLTLLWGPAKDASVPNLVRPAQLAQANSLGLIAAYATFPLAAILFATLAGLASWLGELDALSVLSVNQERLALWVDSLTFVLSAILVMRLPLGRSGAQREAPRDLRVDFAQTGRDVLDGLRFIRAHALVRGVMIGLAGGLLGGGMMIPLGPVFTDRVLGAGSAGFGVLMTSLGVGAAIGVVSLLWLQRWLPGETVFVAGVAVCGLAIMLVACLSNITPAAFVVAVVGAAAGTAYVTGFTVLQREVHDEMRGRTFATLYTIVRLCLLLSLTLSPIAAGLLDNLSEWLVDREVEISGVGLALPGVRIALLLGGAFTVVSAAAAHRRMRLAHRAESAAAATQEAAA